MAIKSTVFKLNLTISDMNRGYYAEHVLTLARHPSETDVRMMLRIAAFALNAHERLVFTKGLSDVDEPDIWQKSLSGDIEEWIELGQPIDKRIRQACGKSQHVSIYSYQRGSINIWYEGIKASLERFKHLRVFQFVLADESQVERLMDRSMTLNCLIEDQYLMFSNDTESLSIEVKPLKQEQR